MSTEWTSDEPDAGVPAADAPTDGTRADQDPAADGILYEEQVQPEYGILGLTLRELLIVGAWALAFIASFFPVVPGGSSVWSQGIAWVLSIGVPTAAVFLVVLRRFSPDGIRRVGSLGIDQFASVAFSVASVIWLQALWAGIARSIEFEQYLAGWVPILETLLMLALVTFTVAAPLIPGLREDFHGRLETLAHRNANPVRPVIARPRPDKPAAAAQPAPATVAAPPVHPDTDADEPADDLTREHPVLDDGIGDVHELIAPTLEEPARPAQPGDDEAPAAAQPRMDTETTMVIQDGDDDALDSDNDAVDADRSDVDKGDADENGARLPVSSHASGGDTGTSTTVSPGDYAPSYSRRSTARDPETDGQPAPFWILVPTERDVLDENGRPLFRIGPTAWALAIEDRGGAYVVRHDDGRIGYLHDITDVTKG
ncbi:hypothetical protein [Microbacterium sp.]|uniref:hypothetical protein n=1 Tax=Microbacterium sp. TaxID=51671 RepID=UPI0028124374|nr:hypothetical protein [Microbacterium sp.]